MKKICALVMAITLALTICSCSVIDGSGLGAEASVSPIFSDNMVIQRDKKVPVFGTGTDGTEVTVSFDKQTKKTVVEDGKWQVTLDEMKADTVPQLLKISAGGKNLFIRNVLIGDVWICSGQSNMVFYISMCDAIGKRELKNCTDSTILRCNQGGSWLNVNADTLDISALAVAFGYRLQSVTGVPIGVVVRAVGDTEISQWLPGGSCYPRIESIIGTCAAGILWYQGENDSRPEKEPLYLEKYKTLCANFRTLFGAELPIIAVQLANCKTGDDGFKTFRLVQQECEKAVENSYLACQLDYTRSVGTIHPSNKYVLGTRIADIVLEKIQKLDGYYGTSAYLDGITAVEGGLKVSFANVHGKLEYVKKATTVSEFRTVSSDGTEATIENAVIVSDNEVFLPLESLDGISKITYCVYRSTVPTVSDSFKNPVMPFVFDASEIK